MDKCPFCGNSKSAWTGCKDDVAQYYEEKFDCGFDMNEEQRPKECYIAEIAALKAQLAERDRLLGLWRALKRYWTGAVIITKQTDPEMKALKAAGELERSDG